MTAPDRAAVEVVKRRLCRGIDALAPDLTALSRAVHSRAETAFREHRSSRLLAGVLRSAGLAVSRPAHGLATAFSATAGDAGPLVVICCEYDALPVLGHACGHNVVAAAGVGAGLALARAAPDLGGRLLVLGTPAEEGGGGKVLLARAGAFQGAAAVLLVHPGRSDVVTPMLRAAASFDVRFTGRAAHAAMAPQEGRNALDAAVLAYQALSAARAALPVAEQITAVLPEGGQAPGVVPDRAVLRVIVRSPGGSGLRTLRGRVLACAAAGARATGCRWSVQPAGPVFRELDADAWLAAKFTANAARLGRRLRPGRRDGLATAGSTDLGTVSHLAPTIHPMLAMTAVDVWARSHHDRAERPDREETQPWPLDRPSAATRRHPEHPNACRGPGSAPR